MSDVSQSQVPFCSVPESVLANAGDYCRWPSGHVITYTIERKLDVFSDQSYRDLIDLAWAPWLAESGARVEYVESNPNVIFTTRRIDGKSNVLGQAELACGTNANSRRRCWFDVAEDWVNASNPHAGAIDFLRTAIHEIGHILGIGHAPSGTPAIMAAFLSGHRTLQKWDKQQIVRRYSGPETTPDPLGNLPCELGQLLTCFDVDTRRYLNRAVANLLRAWRNNQPR